jgi:hypothetical protein
LNSEITAIGFWALAFPSIRLSIGSSKACPRKPFRPTVFLSLTLDQVYGAISYYLTNRAEIDRYLQESDKDYEAFRQRNRADYPEAHRRLDAILEDARRAQQ